MRTTLDFTPFYRASVGFDRLFDLLDNATRVANSSGGPLYDIARTGEDSYRISVAVPGYDEADIEVTQQPNLLMITGKPEPASEAEYLHKAIPARGFTHRFELADFVEVANASLANGVLTVELRREVPEAMKPRKISIGTGAAMPQQPAQIESRKAA